MSGELSSSAVSNELIESNISLPSATYFSVEARLMTTTDEQVRRNPCRSARSLAIVSRWLWTVIRLPPSILDKKRSLPAAGQGFIAFSGSSTARNCLYVRTSCSSAAAARSSLKRSQPAKTISDFPYETSEFTTYNTAMPMRL